MIPTLGTLLGSGSTAAVVLSYVILALPLLIAAALFASWHDGKRGARRLLIASLVCISWLFMPFRFADLQWAQFSAAISIFCWVWLVYAWAAHVWIKGFGPVWVNIIVAVAISTLIITTLVLGISRALS